VNGYGNTISDLDDLPMDVFELSSQGLEVDSLTAGHGMGELSASCSLDGCSCGGE
jgi:hypothetical protein